MANEITARAYLSCTKTGATATGDVTDQNTLSGTGIWQNTQAIGTSSEALAFPGDLTTEGVTYLWLYNSDSTNYIEIGTAESGGNVTQKFCKLLAGEVTLLRVYTGNPTYYAQANTAACNLRMVAVGT
jgi:hypothetical protein